MSRYPPPSSLPQVQRYPNGLPSQPSSSRSQQPQQREQPPPRSTSSNSLSSSALPDSSPRRPTRSIRRPNIPSAEFPDSQFNLDPNSFNTRSNQQDRTPSPELERRQPTWEEDRSLRREAQTKAENEQQDGAEVYKTAKLGQVLSSALNDRRRKDVEEKKIKGRRQQREEGEGDDGEYEGFEDILRLVKRDWAFVTDPDFNPIPLALMLLTPVPNSPLTLSSFHALSVSLLRSLQSTVQTHSSSFAASISTHNSFFNSLSQAQLEVREARATLAEAKEALSGERKAEVGALWGRGRMVKDMLGLLDVIEHLKSVPDQLETLMQEKRLLLASLILVRSLKTITKPEMMEIGALADLRAYLLGQEVAMREILIEELHNHLYLKTYYTDSRWQPYTRGQTSLPDLDPNSTTTSNSSTTLPPTTSRSGLLSPSATTSSLPPPSPISPSSPFPSSSLPSPSQPSNLASYLQDLATRPSQDPILDIPDDFDALPPPPVPSHNRGGSTNIPGTSGASFSSFGPSAGAGGGVGGQNATPESDSFVYIEHLLEALAALGRLGWGLDLINQREAGEIFAVVEGTIGEVEERSSDRRRQSSMLSLSNNARLFLPPPPSATEAFEATSSASGGGLGGVGGLGGGGAVLSLGGGAGGELGEENSETLRDLFWTTYSKLDAVLQGLRVVWEVAGRIGGRKDFKDASGTVPRRGAGAVAGDVIEIWKPIQTEIRSLLREYLTNEDAGSVSSRHPITSINEVLRDGKTTRDRSKPIFRLIDSDSKITSKLLKRHDDELTRSLRSSVPGLVNLSSDPSNINANSSSLSDERFSTTHQPTSHRLLVTPDAFNVSVLFQPTLSFLKRAAAIMPVGIEDESSGLDEFVVKVYLPQLEEKVSELVQMSLGASGAFQEDATWRSFSTRPVVKSSTQVLTVIESLCSMLRTTPFHRENYSRLIISVIIQFYQRCSGSFRDIVARGDQLTLSGLWAQRAELVACMEELLRTPDDQPEHLREIGLQETRLEMILKADKLINEEDLISSTRKFGQLGNLYQSLIWFMGRLSTLKSVAPEGASSPVVDLDAPEVDPMDIDNEVTDDSADASRLPLTKAMSQRLDALLETYRQLAEMVLFTMRIEVRCRVMHFMDLAMRQGNYRLEQEAFEPDPNVIDMIADLARFEEVASTTLGPKEKTFVLRGLGALADDLLVSSSRYLRFANAHGVRKILRNVLALQQSVKTLVDDPSEADFERGRTFWNLFFTGPEELLATLKIGKPQFAFEEYKALLSLQLGIDQGAAAGAAGGDRKAFNSAMIELMELCRDE